jgi:hypothetical protein
MGRVSVTARFNVFRARRKATVIAVSGKYQVFDLAKKARTRSGFNAKGCRVDPERQRH